MMTSPPDWGLPPPPPPVPPPPPPPLLPQAAPTSAVTTRNTAERRMERMASLPLSAGMTDISQCENLVLPGGSSYSALPASSSPLALARHRVRHFRNQGSMPCANVPQ